MKHVSYSSVPVLSVAILVFLVTSILLSFASLFLFSFSPCENEKRQFHYHRNDNVAAECEPYEKLTLPGQRSDLVTSETKNPVRTRVSTMKNALGNLVFGPSDNNVARTSS